MLRPFRPVPLTKVATECFLAPWAIAGIGNGRERRHRLVLAWIFKELPS